MKGIAYYTSLVGELLIESENEKIVTLGFLKDSKQEELRTSAIDQCIKELEDYFFSDRKFFSFEMNLIGTEFQIKVWNELLNIPFGKTVSYESWRFALVISNRFARSVWPTDKTQSPLLFHVIA